MRCVRKLRSEYYLYGTNNERVRALMYSRHELVRNFFFSKLKKMENFPPSYLTNVMTLIFTLSIFHSRQVIYHLALLMAFTSRSSLDMQDVAHTVMISGIAISAT